MFPSSSGALEPSWGRLAAPEAWFPPLSPRRRLGSASIPDTRLTGVGLPSLSFLSMERVVRRGVVACRLLERPGRAPSSEALRFLDDGADLTTASLLEVALDSLGNTMIKGP